MKDDGKSPQDRIIHEPGSVEDARQQMKDATDRLIEVGLGGEGAYPWGSPYAKE